MKRLGLLLVGAAVVALSVYVWRTRAATAPAAAQIRPTSVILISIDTLRPDRLGAYGYASPTSPNIDRFAADSVVYQRAFAHAPATLISHASILTSRVPAQHNASYTAFRAVAPEAVTLAEVLRGAGHRTFAVTGGGQLGAAYGLDQGFDRYTELTRLTSAVDEALAEIDRDRSRPFFLFFHTYAVHHPYAPSADALAALPSDYHGPVGNSATVEFLDNVNSGRQTITTADRRQVSRLYDAGIRGMDAELGRLFDALAARRIYDDALIVFTSDHGEEFDEHGMIGWHSHTLYDELLRVPLIVKLPGGASKGTRIGDLARGIDIAPTILNLLGGPPAPTFAGAVLPPFAPPAGDDAVIALRREPLGGESHPTDGLRTREWKFDGTRLFDLRVDATETRDVAAARPQVVRALLAELSHWQAQVDQGPTFTPDRELLERLRSLGYTGR